MSPKLRKSHPNFFVIYFVTANVLHLGLGLFLCLTRGLLVELSPNSGGGMFVWFTIAALHYTQLAEPPINPLTAKG